MEPGQRRRVIAFLATLALQAVAVVALLSGLRMPAAHRHADDVASTLIFFSPPAPPAATPPPPPRPPPRKRPPATAIPAPAMAPVPSPLPASPAAAPAHAIDWAAQASDVAAGLASAPSHQTFSSPVDHSRDAHPDTSVLVHKAGDQYTDRFGDRIFWVSSRCYVVSEARPPGESGILADATANARPTRTGCLPTPYARGDLFKDLPAYKGNE